MTLSEVLPIEDWEHEEGLFWDEMPEGMPLHPQDYAEPTRELDGEEPTEDREEFEEFREPLGKSLEKQKLGCHRTASTA